MTSSFRSSGKALAYQRKNIQGDSGAFRPHSVAACSSCPETLALPLREREPIEMTAKKFRAQGWEFDPYNARRIRCPKCLDNNIARRKGESPKETTNVTTIPTALALAPAKTVLTVNDRERLRSHLDGVFDAAKGFYLDDWTDARVAREFDVPEKLVREYRDLAFGPLKAAPELDAITVELARLTTSVTEMEKALSGLRSSIGKAHERQRAVLQRMGLG